MGVWREAGYSDFADGTSGNGDQNLYVSRSGVLQRVFQFDVNGDGYVDLMFATSQNHDERPPVHVIRDPLGAAEVAELPTLGAYAGALADLNGDGYDDLVVAHHQRFFAHSSSACFTADFDEDGWIDLAVGNHKTYGNHVGRSQVWWNGPQGFSEERLTWLPTLGPLGMTAVEPANIADRGPEEYYVSSPFELPAGARVVAIRWEGLVPPRPGCGRRYGLPTARRTWPAPPGGDRGTDASGSRTGRRPP